jgi:hypothetical protein
MSWKSGKMMEATVHVVTSKDENIPQAANALGMYLDLNHK